MMGSCPPGSFSNRVARRRINRKPDRGLVEGVCQIIPNGSRIVDLGTSTGGLVTVLRERGYDVDGFDGTPDITRMTDGLVTHADLTTAIDTSTYDWTISLEVGEHIPAEFQETYLDNLVKSKQGLIVSWAVPGQRGRGHVNCRTPEWVIDQVMSRGWVLWSKKIKIIRDLVSGNKRLLVFRHPEHSRSFAQVLSTVDVSYGAEVGVGEGTNSCYLLRRFQGVRMLLVDRYVELTTEEKEAFPLTNIVTKTQHDFEIMQQKAMGLTSFARDRREFIIKDSREAASRIPDGDLDFVFIDASHDYDSVRTDIEAWDPKVREGGIVGGHDYGGVSDKRGRFGVKKAVDERYDVERVNICPGLVWWVKK